jgi:DNA/RNA endonuclease G (NUC1)
MVCKLIHYVYFSLCFDYSLRQAEYVEYIQQTKGGCSSNPTFKQEPEQAYSYDDYKPITSKYDHGHLVPNADYGCQTYIMGNVVAQLRGFNRGVWRVNEEYIRKTYPGKKIQKGCKYTGRNEAGINIPEGCYWLVFTLNGTLIENGYVDQFTGEKTKELPDWHESREKNLSWIYILPTGTVFWFCIVWFLLRSKQSNQEVPLNPDAEVVTVQEQHNLL